MNKLVKFSFRPIIGVLLVGAFTVSACGEVRESGDEEPGVSVDLGPGETRGEQIDEIGVVVGLLEEHIGEGLVLRSDVTDEWTPEYHEEHRRPTADCPGEGQYRSEVFFTHPDISLEDAYSAAERIVEELGFAPNEALLDTGAGSTRMMYSAGSGDGRTFVVRESRSEEENVQIIYNTRCTEHESHQQAMDRFVEQSREERQREREE